jgi:hypothetical protein
MERGTVYWNQGKGEPGFEVAENLAELLLLPGTLWKVEVKGDVLEPGAVAHACNPRYLGD